MPDSTMRYTIIVAHDPNLVIGKDGQLPWHFPEDLKHFKRTTMGQPLFMGRKTYESIGSKPLPGRPCFVLSSSAKYDNAKTFNTLEKALAWFEDSEYDRIFVVGGGRLYKRMLDEAVELIITEIKQPHEGDIFFPEYRDRIGTDWELIEHTEHPDFTIKTYSRIDQSFEL